MSDVESPPDIIVTSGSPEPAELAAVTVVIQGVLDEIELEKELTANGTGSAWQRAQRPIRQTVVRGGWRSFAG